jgi:hypothetical protein
VPIPASLQWVASIVYVGVVIVIIAALPSNSVKMPDDST